MNRYTITFVYSPIYLVTLLLLSYCYTTTNAEREMTDFSGIVSANSQGSNDVKSVFLIRHAESEENRRFGCLKSALSSFTKFSLPSSTDVGSAMELFNVKEQIDSNVSETGKLQIERMADVLEKADFLVTNKIELVAHSTLIRARETCKGMLGCMAPSIKSKTVQRVVETELLIEKTPKEWIPGNYGSFVKRMTEFESWLDELPESSIVLVGHSQFFKALLQLDYKFGNCDVWKVDFNGKASSNAEKWSNLVPVFKDESPESNSVASEK